MILVNILGPLRLPSKVLTGPNSALNSPNCKKGEVQKVKCEGDVRHVFANPNTPAARGVNPRPGADFSSFRGPKIDPKSIKNQCKIDA